MLNKYTLKLNILRVTLITTLFFALFVPNFFTRNVTAIFLGIYATITYILVRKKDKISMYKRPVIIQMLIFGFIYIAIYYSLGIFFGFYKNYTRFEFLRVKTYIIPFIIIITSSELLRYQLIDKRSKFSKIIVFLIMVLIDIVVYWKSYNIAILEELLSLVGLVIFSSISNNLLYNYITLKFGFKPLIVYRLITIVSLYFIPIVPNVYTFLRIAFRIIAPYAIYLFLEYSYTKKKKKSAVAEDTSIWKRCISGIFTAVIAILIVMIISCKFYVGIFAVATDSMTGVINKGDAVVYFQYKGEEVKEGQILVFKKNNLTFVHRVINVMNINNEMHYITKGDYNEYEDDGYITKEDIIGFSKFRIMYIGYPTVWLSNMFS